MRRFELTARGLTAEASGEAAGTLDNLALNGTATARIADLSGLSGLLGRSLAGAVDARSRARRRSTSSGLTPP
ncbi:MAG: hypothetical protein JKP98_07285 [Rhodobacteraceae bacterium]|nr:hypothetical protein [Paracoccaceae bacterium]